MKTWRRVVCLAAAMLVVVVGLVACAPSAKAIPADEAEVLRGELEPMVDNLLAGLEGGNYAAFSRDFDAQMREAMTEAKFADLRAQFDEKLGRYQVRQFVKAEEIKGFTALIYDARFEDEEQVTVRVVFRQQDGQWLVTGLWFDSPKLRAK